MKWMKPSSLPVGFQGWCWVSRRLNGNGVILPPNLRYMRHMYNKLIPEVHEYGAWFSIYDGDNRVLILDEPLAPTDGEWSDADSMH